MLTPHHLASTLLTGAARVTAPLLTGCTSRVLDGSRTLYLTFDDGPRPDTTPELLDVLDGAGAGATFFLLGEHVRREPGLARAIIDRGHVIGQHSHTHADPWRMRTGTVVAEMERATSSIEEATGHPVAWMRPPYGHLTPALARWAREKGQQVAMWDVMPGDHLSSASTESVSEHVLRYVRPGSVVVLHENRRAREVTLPAVGRILPALAAEDYRCARL